MFRKISMDMQAVLERDPAARSRLEVFLCYPGFHAVVWHRAAHWLYAHKLFLPARIISQCVRNATGIEIHPGAEIGEGLFIDHGMGVVIGETTVIGKNCTLYQGATLGGTGKDTGKRHPTLGDSVMVSSGAKVLGPITVGSFSKIGAGSVVLRDVPENCTVVGIPGRIVRNAGLPVPQTDLDQIHLPDPVSEYLQNLTRRIEKLEKDAGIPCENTQDGAAIEQKEETGYEDL